MCTVPSYSRSAMLRRQCDPVDVIQGLFNSKSRRNLSAASILHTKKIVGGRDGFLTWLKDIFNKSAKDKNHKADTVIIDRATTFNQPEIATSMRPADFSDKVDVINQEVANLQSMTKFEYGNIRAEKRDADNGGRAYAIQQSAIYDTSSRFAAGKTSEREIGPDSSRRDPGKVYRFERNGGAIEFAARNDLDVASYYRCYMSPRHCYRLPPQRTKQPPLGLCVPNRYINMSTRTIIVFALRRNSKPPIKEPNAPEKREKKDEKKNEKKDRKEKKPVIRTDGESVSVDSSENQAEMVANDNPRSDPDAAFRYEWGVKLAEEQSAHDNDKFAEKGQRYVTKRLWGVNLKQPNPDIAPLATANSKGGAEKVQNASSIFESGDTTADGAKSGAETVPKESVEKSSLKDTTMENLSTPSCRTDSSDDSTATQQDSGDASSHLSSEELRKIMKTSPDMLEETIVVDDEFNVPEGAGLDTEITAWRNLMMRSVPKVKENYLSSDNVENLEVLSIRPEAPQPQLDMRVVSSIKDNLKNKEVEQSDSGYMLPKSTEVKKVRSLQRSDSYSVGKKLHTMNTQIRYLHRHTSSIIQQHVGLFSSNCVSINRPMMKCPGFMSAFSTESEDSESQAINEASNQQIPKQQIDSKSQNEENSNDPNLNNISKSNRSHLLAESQTFSSNQDVDFAKTLDVIADKEMEISMNQLQNTGHLSDSIVSSEFTQKDKSCYKDEDVQDEIKHYEESYTDLHSKDATKHVDLNDLSTDNKSIKSDAIKSVKGDLKLKDDNVTIDSNVKDTNDDSNKEYVIDGDYVRLPGDPYPYNRENLDKWHVPQSKDLVHKPWKRETSCSSDSPTVARSTLRNANDAYTNAVGEPCDSHAGNAVMETSGSGGDGGASAKKRMRQANGFHVSSRRQRVVSDCLRGDAADAMGLPQWTEAFSRLGEKINEAARSGDNASFRARYE